MLSVVRGAEQPRPGATTGPTSAPASRPALSKILAPSGVPAWRVVADLESADPLEREAATAQLNSLGGNALPILERAVRSHDSPEVRPRLERALQFVRVRARREQAQVVISDWVRAQLMAAYDKGPSTNPAYDADVRAAIDAWGDLPLDPASGPADLRERVLAGFGRAIAKGCADPYVLSLYHHTRGDPMNSTGDGALRKTYFTCVRETLDHAPYPPCAQLLAAARYLRTTGDLSAEVLRYCKPIVAALAATPDAPAAAVDGVFAELYDAAMARQSDPSGAVQALVAAYEKAAPAGRAGPLVARGYYQIDAAWMARGNGWANTVTPEQWKAFHERLDAAEQALTKAYELDPTEYRAPTLMITVMMGRAGGAENRAVMETWYRRAMEANPDHLDACWRKLRYLYPRWHGSHAEMIAFGRECLATANYRGRVPMMLVEAHAIVAGEGADTKEYYARPDVWADVRAVYEGHLTNFPADAVRRSAFAKFACYAGQWAIADRQFKQLGEKADPGIFGGAPTLAYYRKKAARLAAEPPAEAAK